jgi:hypothetical protein
MSVSTKKISKAVFTRHLTDLLGKISAKDKEKSGVFTLNGIAYIQGYKWKAQDQNGGCFLNIKKPIIDDDGVETENEEDEEVEYELA